MDRGEKRETKDLRRRSECYTMRQKMADSDRAEGGIKGTSPRLRLGGISPNEGNSWTKSLGPSQAVSGVSQEIAPWIIGWDL